jgi:AcrR family transcriptional regulator
MSSKSAEKREFILSKAEQLFIRCGYHSITMKDIIDECNISRGGIYLYFNSVDQIFMEVIKAHNRQKLEQVELSITEESDFQKLLNEFFRTQKERLLHMEGSLKLAMYEFFLSHKSGYDRNFFNSQFRNTRNMISEILKLGSKKGLMDPELADTAADTIMFLIEGLSSLAMTGGITPELIDSQFDFIKKLIVIR